MNSETEFARTRQKIIGRNGSYIQTFHGMCVRVCVGGYKMQHLQNSKGHFESVVIEDKMTII